MMILVYLFGRSTGSNSVSPPLRSFWQGQLVRAPPGDAVLPVSMRARDWKARAYWHEPLQALILEVNPVVKLLQSNFTDRTTQTARDPPSG
jgi:hypothetical protein